MNIKEINRKYYYSAAAAVVVFILSLVFIRGCFSSGDTDYEYEKISKGDIEKTIAATGHLEVIDPRAVISKIDGTVERVEADYNSTVERGELLAVIDSEKHDHALKELKTSLETARLEYAAAENDYQSSKEMHEEDLISEQAYKLSEKNYKKARNELNAVESDYNRQKERQQHSRVRAPVSGIVLAREVESNQQIGEGEKLFKIVPALDEMLLEIQVDESDIGYVEKGQKVEFTVSAYPERKFSGEIIQVQMKPETDGSVVSYKSVVRCSNDELLLKPAMTATTTISVGSKEDVLRISNSALLSAPEGKERGNRNAVWVKSGDEFEKVEIETGLEGDSYTEIISGLKKGDIILAGTGR